MSKEQMTDETGISEEIVPKPSRYQDKVMRKLDELGANKVCQACGNEGRTVLSMVTHIGASPQGFGQEVIGDIGIPAAIIACTKCGDLRFHSLIALKLV